MVSKRSESDISPPHDPTIPIYTALGQALTQWSAVEGALCGLYTVCVNPHNSNPAIHGFWGIVSFEAKLSMSDRAICVALFSHPTLKSRWDKINGALSDNAKKLNKLAHGYVVTKLWKTNRGKWKNDLYFEPYYFRQKDTVRPTDEERNNLNFDPRSQHRLYAKNIARFGKEFQAIKIRTNALADKVFEIALREGGL